MKKVVIYYFSGTGNTKKTVDAYCKEFQDKGCSVDIVTTKDASQWVEQQGCEGVCSYDLSVIAFPVHAFSVPEPMLELLKALPQCTVEGSGRSPRFVIVSTSGEPLLLNDAAAAQAASILTKKGYFAQAAYRYVMPYNMIFKHTDEYAQAMFSTMRALVKLDVAKALDGTVELPRVGRAKRLVATLFSVEHKAMHRIGKGFKVNADCTSCGKCARGCTRDNITMVNGQPIFGAQCVGCMQCSFLCPKQAIRIGILNGWRVCGEYPDNHNAIIAVPKAKVSDKPHYQGFMRKRYVAYFQNAQKKIANHDLAIDTLPETE